ncbi:c-type cytochrome [Crateriforma conspicua]|uniref:c-type cytochrome n=1 Tax=Crateriforma conspicua TaxID=2527996 RepID=UPI00118BAAE1|nr:cytochrome c [Crateriforma conspicua]QDV65794.1 Cytochrome c [Crateriforma conspicua]
MRRFPVPSIAWIYQKIIVVGRIKRCPPSVQRLIRSFALVLITSLLGSIVCAENSDSFTSVEASAEAVGGDARRGLRLLLETPLIPSDFDQETFDAVWQSWPEPLRSRAEQSTPEIRRQMAFERYGLTPRPAGLRDVDDRPDERPMQYVVDDQGRWTMNCLACHGGMVDGQPSPGAPNNRFALQTFTEEIRATKWILGKPLARMDLGAMVIPLGSTHGTTNAVVFGMGLMHYRDAELNFQPKIPGKFTHHDMDAPPWWHFAKRPYIYIDGFAAKGHRGLMQFMLVPENGPTFFSDHEDDFRDVYAYLSSLTPPKFEGEIDTAVARQGKVLFEEHCARCHGTYGTDGTYPNQRVPIDDIGTDRVRFDALSVSGRQKYADSWFAKTETPERRSIAAPDGYVAPPLDGIWASAPYFHNGSVPTLWGVLNPEQRPAVWRSDRLEFDSRDIGLRHEVVDQVPVIVSDAAVRRTYFDTRLPGKSRTGHDYPDVLTDLEKRAVLEYLKTL